MRIGLISDTHGLLRPEALDFLRGCAHILHAGDIGKPEILEILSAIAPVNAVRGNNDTGPWAQAIPETQRLVLGGIGIHLLHDLAALDVDPLAAGMRVVVTGHSHKPVVRERDGVLYVNPGSAGPRRFTLPVSVGELLIEAGEVSARTIALDIAPRR